MNFLRQTLDQFFKFFLDLPPSQRVSVGTVVLLVAGGLGYLVYRGTVPDEEALLAGKTFSAEELKVAQEALDAGGMTAYRVEGMKLYVPRAQSTSYNAALIRNDGVPANFQSELSNLHKNMNPFIGSQQREQMIEAAKADELCKMIRQVPEVQEAQLVPSAHRDKGLYGSMKRTAALTVRARAGRTISPRLAASFQRTVAAGLGMTAEDVTVMDSSGRSFTSPDENDPYRSAFVERKREFADDYERQIREALAERIPNVIVAVNVELDTLRLSREQTMSLTKALATKTSEQEETDDSTQASPNRQPGVTPNQPRDLTGGGAVGTDRRMKKTLNTTENVPGEQTVKQRDYEPNAPKSVQATVSIPEDHFKRVALAKGESEANVAKFQARVKEIRDATILEVQKTVAALLPPPVPPAKFEDLVKVSTYDRLQEGPTAEPAMTAMLQDAALQYAGPAALCLFALWALMSLQRSLPKPPPEPAPVASASVPAGHGGAPGEGEAGETDAEVAPRKETTPRDRLQTSVRDNPEMAAAVLERWIKTPAR